MGLIVFIFAIIFVVVSVAVFAYESSEGSSHFLSVGLSFVGALFFFLSCVTVVGARNVGVEVSFGKTVSTLGPGFHMKRPWANVYDWDGTNQVLKDTGVPVRLANNSTAHVSVRIQWHLNPDADIKALYGQWRSFGKLEQNVIEPQLSRSLNDVFGTYDPLALDVNGKPEVIVTSLADPVKADMIRDLPKGITISLVSVIGYQNDNSVQSQINQLVAQSAALKSAQLQKQINQATAEANKALVANGQDLSLDVLIQNCLSITQQALNKGQTPPAGWNCFNQPNVAVR